MKMNSNLKQTPLHALHLTRGARMVGFAGYEMPVQFPPGVMKEHLHTRSAAGLFDVSHMGQIAIRARSGQVADAALALEALVPVDLLSLPVGRQRYALFTNEAGGVLDDLMVARLEDRLVLVVNAACKDADLARLRDRLSTSCEIEPLTDRALLALQGPEAAVALLRLGADLSPMRFMDAAEVRIAGVKCLVTRSGYSGEDGFEISAPADQAMGLAESLLANDAVAPIGLGARDSLRLEAGLCLYGHDMDETTSPVEAGLSWAIQKSRRRGGARPGGFPGATRILAELETGPARLRVGLRPDGRAPVREGAPLFADETAERPLGAVTSGGFGPSIGAPIAMGYVPAPFQAPGAALFADVRGKRLPVTVTSLPFTSPTYKR